MTPRLQRYSILRFVVALAILVSAMVLVATGGWDVRGSTSTFFRLVAGQLLVLVLTTLWARRNRASAVFIYVQLAVDVAGASLLAAWTGGAGSLLTFLYFPTIAAGAYLLGRNAALAAAGFSTVGLLSVAIWTGPGAESSLELLYWETGFRVLSYFLVAILAGQLAASLEVAGAELRAQRIASETVIERVRAGVLTTDRHDLVVDINPSGRLLVGEAAGRRLADVFAGAMHHRSWEELRPDGRRWVCSQAAMPDGGRVVVVEDVTELWAMRERAQRDEQFVAVGKLSAGLAHEIRNPLAALSGTLQLIHEDRPSREVQVALREAERLNRLVEDFLEAAREPTLRRVPSDVGALVRGCAEAFQSDPRYLGKVEVEIEADAAHAEVDPDRIRQVVWNLLLNAAQSMPEGGTISLRVRRAEDGSTGIEVADRGVGIAAEERRRIFDPFYTRRSGGTGLGLALVDQVVRGHGGTIEVSPRDGGGTEFRLFLPAAATGS
ncbi:MAG: hypothetical protein FJ102_13370 [Deltaproteobacteria bacterium]|nr:hypothetical protein [Deltaproteobacteria bacterium]